jgi:hypothetical protein
MAGTGRHRENKNSCHEDWLHRCPAFEIRTSRILPAILAGYEANPRGRESPRGRGPPDEDGSRGHGASVAPLAPSSRKRYMRSSIIFSNWATKLAGISMSEGWSPHPTDRRVGARWTCCGREVPCRPGWSWCLPPVRINAAPSLAFPPEERFYHFSRDSASAAQAP